HRPPVEGALERDDSGPSGCLARVLERGLDGLRAGVAEERLRPAEALREPARELGHRLRPVEVRDVPESFELGLRGGEGCRMAVPEPDDRDPGDEVEIARSVLAVEPGALAARQRDAVARIGREDGCFQDRTHVTTAVSPISARTPSRAAVTAARSFGTIPPSSSPPSRSRSASPTWIACTTASSS